MSQLAASLTVTRYVPAATFVRFCGCALPDKSDQLNRYGVRPPVTLSAIEPFAAQVFGEAKTVAARVQVGFGQSS